MAKMAAIAVATIGKERRLKLGPPQGAALPLIERVLVGVDDGGQLVRVRVVVEVAGVGVPGDLGLEGRAQLLVDEVAEVDLLEPLVLLDVVDPVLQVPVALAKVRGEQLLDEPLRVLVEGLREDDLPAQDLLVDAHGVLVAERRLADDHLIDEDAEGPPVDGLAVALVQQHLWCDVLGRSTECVRSCPRLHDLREAEVGEFRVPVWHHQDVLGLQVPVDDVLAVDVRERRACLRGVKLGLIVGELPRTPEVREEFAAADDLHDDVDVVLVLGVAHHVDDEGVVDLRHQPLLVVNVVHLLQLDDLMFLHEFHGVVLAILFVFRELDPPEGAAAQRTDHLKVGQNHLLRHDCGPTGWTGVRIRSVPRTPGDGQRQGGKKGANALGAEPCRT
mmetsp:Transcript_81445/g.230789  ORF Transcript_81445/g.230789 Transcript_81445/m.230789 type:complete len:389 (+) Transcript_81445:44-1210(+)